MDDVDVEVDLDLVERGAAGAGNHAQHRAGDAGLQQAIGMLDSEQEANTVVSVLQKGYTIADRVLRPALVMVAKPKS